MAKRDSGSTSVRKVQTGEDENGNPIEVYEFGAKIDGVFVPFLTKPAGYIEHLAEARKAAQEQEQGTGTEATPDENES